LRRDFATSDIPVIAVTASVMHDQRAQVTSAGSTRWRASPSTSWTSQDRAPRAPTRPWNRPRGNERKPASCGRRPTTI
jgi:CheY-like chemotaxis protein